MHQLESADPVVQWNLDLRNLQIHLHKTFFWPTDFQYLLEPGRINTTQDFEKK